MCGQGGAEKLGCTLEGRCVDRTREDSKEEVYSSFLFRRRNDRGWQLTRSVLVSAETAMPTVFEDAACINV